MWLVGSVLIKQLTNDVAAWIPWLIDRLVKRAVSQLTPDKQARYDEEWRSYINDIPGELFKLGSAVGLVFAARKMSGSQRGALATDLTRRAVDVNFSLALLFLCLPLMVVSALLIRLTSRGPIFSRSPRMGRGGRVFWVYKFRTLKGIGQWSPIYEINERHVEFFSGFFGVGLILRKLRIDELPALLNVLRGEMSFIGPAPRSPSSVERFAKWLPHYGRRHDVKPGLTGLAQIHYTYPAIGDFNDALNCEREILALDLKYVETKSVAVDFRILLRTFSIVLFGDNRGDSRRRQLQ